VRYTLDKPYWLIGAKDATGTEPDDTKAALAFRSLGFTLNINSAGVEVGLDAGGTLRLPKPSADLGGDPAAARPSETPLTLGALVRLGANPSFTLVVQLGGDANKACTPQNEGALRDVFGQKGLTVCHLGLSGELSASPSLSASASFTLPDEWSKQLGASNAALRVGFSVSATRPCVDLAIEQIDPNRPAMDLFDKGVVITNQAHLLVAPTGCQLPRGGGALKTIDPGFRLDFDGVVLGAKVSVFAEIKRSGAAFAVDAGFKSDELELGALKFGKTDIHLKADPTAGSTSISVKTSAELGTSAIAKGSFHLDAAFSVSSSRASRQISGSGGVEFSLAGASSKGSLALDFSLERGEPRGSFSGSLEADLKIFTYGVTVKTLVYDRGLQALDVSAHGMVAFGVGELSASGSFTYAKKPGKTHINLSGTFAIWNVYTRSVTLDMDLGRLKLPFSFGPKEGALRIPSGALTVVRVSGLNEGDVDARTDGQTTTDLTREVEVDSCDKLEFFCLEVHSVKLNRRTGVLEGKVLGVFNVSVSARELATEKNHPPTYATRLGNLVNESQGRCLDVPGAKYNELQPLGTFECVGAPNERWSLAPPGLFHAKAALPTKCLDATINRGDNARPILFTCTPDVPNHRWHFDDRGRLHAITFGHQDRCLAAVPTTNASGEVRMGVCNDSKDQRWTLTGRIARPSGCEQLHRAVHTLRPSRLGHAPGQRGLQQHDRAWRQPGVCVHA
jgi:hypothetical protein